MQNKWSVGGVGMSISVEKEGEEGRKKSNPGFFKVHKRQNLFGFV